MNCTPFVRQYVILNNKWGALLCQKEYRTRDILRNSKNCCGNHALSYRETERQYGVARSRIRGWERIYLEEGAKGLAVERRGRKSTGRPVKPSKSVEEDLIAKNQRLCAEVEYLKYLQALVLERARQGKKPW